MVPRGERAAQLTARRGVGMQGRCEDYDSTTLGSYAIKLLCN